MGATSKCPAQPDISFFQPAECPAGDTCSGGNPVQTGAMLDNFHPAAAGCPALPDNLTFKPAECPAGGSIIDRISHFPGAALDNFISSAVGCPALLGNPSFKTAKCPAGGSNSVGAAIPTAAETQFQPTRCGARRHQHRQNPAFPGRLARPFQSSSCR